MKKILYLLTAVLLLNGCASDAEGDNTGSIYGVITDKATGEPVRSAGVQLSPTGTKTITGSEGQYEFTNLEAGAYTIQVTKTGYTDLVNYKITVQAGKTNKGDVQIEKLPPSLRITNNDKQDITDLDFGEAEADITRSFNIFNDGVASLEWEITNNCNWITKVSKENGTISAGATQAIVITIDRDLLGGGENTTTIHVTSNNGSSQLVIKAIGMDKSLAALNTLEATGITSNSATFHGVITAEGLPTYTERGFVYAMSSMPTIENTISKLTAVVDATKEYSASATGLVLDNTYYVRAYAINRVGVAYSSNEYVFETIAELPAVTTQDVTNKNIGTGSVTFNGTVVSVGDPAYIERGIVYGTTHNPTIDDNKRIAPGNGTGAFSVNITNLPEGNTYYVRAYATNAKGTAYGTEVNFDFKATMPVVETKEVTNKNIGEGKAVFNGNITSLGDLSYTERGFVYSPTHTPTTDDAKVIVPGTGTGSFTASCSALVEGNIYHIRAFVTNSKGTVYGEKVMLDFNAEVPVVETNAVPNKNIGAGTVTFSGNIVSIGDPVYTERGFVYATTHNPTIDNTKVVSSGSGTGVFSANAIGIPEGNVYYARAYATNIKGTSYGSEISFDFRAEMPVVETVAVTNRNIAAGTATFNGNVVSVGDLPYTERGFVYSTTHNPTINDTKKLVSGTSTGIFSLDCTGLEEGYTYNIRAFVTNSKGTVYGDVVTLDFKADVPTLSTQAVTNINIGAGTATFNGTIVAIGDPAYTKRGFAYATTRTPTVNDNEVTATGTGSGSFSLNVTGISEGSVYYVRAYATNAKGTVYGNEVSFDYNAIMPTLSASAVTNINIGAGIATFNGTIASVGDPAYIERGFVYASAHNPTIDDIKKNASGSGTGTFSVNVTNIEEGRIYYVRAYATSSKGTVYSQEVSFDFNAILPTFYNATSVSSMNIANGLASFKASIMNAGDPPYITRGFVYGTTSNPSLETGSIIVVPGIGTEYSAEVSGLVMGTSYYMRGYATSSKGTSYSNQASFAFNPVLPTVTTGTVTNKSSNTATFNGNITKNGDPVYIEKGFVYSTSNNPNITTGTKVSVAGSGTGSYSFNATGLPFDIPIYVRTYVTSSAGTSYGTQTSFTLSHAEIVADYSLNLMVTKSDVGGIINWTNANTQCNNLTLGGYSDWRLPTITELTALYNSTNRPPNIQVFHHVEYPVGQVLWEVFDYYWSSTANESKKVLMTFYNGSQLTESATASRQYDAGSHDYSNFYCRCVRSIQ